MADFASDILWPHSGIFRFFYFIGWVFGFASLLLLVGATVGLFQRPAAPHYLRMMEGLTIVVLIAGTILATAYIGEAWMAETRPNRFEATTFEEVRFSGWYAVFYGLQMTSVIAPQLFWWRWVRRNFVAILIIAIVVNVGIWLERVMIVITEWAQPSTPSSWKLY